MKRNTVKLIGAAMGAALLATIVACDGSGGPAPVKVTPKPPPPDDQKITAPRPPALGGDAVQKTDPPADKPAEKKPG
ncbi:MAG: hypothetical protein FJ253_11420 [Phycisphaerae bacterium]|nr:hypothetical protein [Phycisphaerae bacterium]